MGVKKGMVNNPTGKGGFGDHPENACHGRWRKEDSYTYNVNKFGRMTDIELQEVILQAKGGRAYAIPTCRIADRAGHAEKGRMEEASGYR